MFDRQFEFVVPSEAKSVGQIQSINFCKDK